MTEEFSTSGPAVFVLGAGPVAMALAKGLAECGHPPIGLWARRADAASRAGAFAGIPCFSGANWPASLRSAQVLLLAVRDEAIAEVAEDLQTAGALAGAPVLLHCSGSVAAETVFANIRAGGKGLLHPLRAIVDPGEAASALAATTFGVEGDVAGRAAAVVLAERLGAASISLDADQVAAYHAAAAIASNYLVALLDLAQDVLGRAGVQSEGAREAFVSLAQGSLDNVRRLGLPRALSGPIRRGDGRTIATHLSALGTGPKEHRELYLALGRRCVALSHQCGDASAVELARISELLLDPSDVDPPIG
ncbi:MAG: DUF2520 domain-containing protein [Myxococcales bacterium]|nr:DUF2520 domain-containing protein [Myxococcales bacterium]